MLDDVVSDDIRLRVPLRHVLPREGERDAVVVDRHDRRSVGNVVAGVLLQRPHVAFRNFLLVLLCSCYGCLPTILQLNCQRVVPGLLHPPQRRIGQCEVPDGTHVEARGPGQLQLDLLLAPQREVRDFGLVLFGIVAEDKEDKAGQERVVVLARPQEHVQRVSEAVADLVVVAVCTIVHDLQQPYLCGRIRNAVEGEWFVHEGAPLTQHVAQSVIRKLLLYVEAQRINVQNPHDA
mmetsp:Transcript_54623/g.111520  ORF Transcript_54623/g.111520 Transcript_54623/m.111520 type:complete len:235 (+) Transcript_54623:681-1385(+)